MILKKAILNSELSVYFLTLIFSLCAAMISLTQDFMDSWLVAPNHDSHLNDESGKDYPGTLDNERITVSRPSKELFIY